MTAYQRFALACPRHATDGDKIYLPARTYRLTPEQAADFKANRAEIIAGIRASRKRHTLPLDVTSELIDRYFAGVPEAAALVQSHRAEWSQFEADMWVTRVRQFLKPKARLAA